MLHDGSAKMITIYWYKIVIIFTLPLVNKQQVSSSTATEINLSSQNCLTSSGCAMDY